MSEPNVKREIVESLDKEIDSVDEFAAQSSQSEDPTVESVDAEYAQIEQKGVSAGDLYYDEINDEVYRIEDIDNGTARVSYDNKHEWKETVEDIEDKIDDGTWIPVNEADEPAAKANDGKPYHKLVARNGDVFTEKNEAQDRALTMGLEKVHSYQPNDQVIYAPGKTIAHYREQVSKKGHPSCVKPVFAKSQQSTVSHLLDKGKSKEEAHICAQAIGSSSLVVKRTGRRPDWKERMDKDEDPCWDGYEMQGTKEQDGETVPNCVPKSVDDSDDGDPVKAAEKAFEGQSENFSSTPTGVGGRVTLDGKSVEIPDDPVNKEWIPYEGPQGGEGWQNTQNMEDVRYTEDPPGEIREDYQEFVDEHDWGTDGQGDEDLGVDEYWDLEDENTTDFAHGPENRVDTTGYTVNPEEDVEQFRESEASDRLLEGLKSGQVAGFTTLADLTTRGQNGYNPRDENVNMVGLKSRNLEGEEVQNLDKETIIDFYKDNADILSESPAFRIGGYKFPNEDKMSLDVVAAVEDDEEARELGEMADQWSFVNLREVAKEGWGEGEVELGGDGDDTLETKEEIMDALEGIESLKKAILTALSVHGVIGNGGDVQMAKDKGAPQRYIHEDSGTEQSVYDLAIGARHAELDKDPDEGPDGAVRFNGDLYVPADTE